MKIMDSEQIIFLLLAIGFSILSMYLKSKKQKHASQKREEPDYRFSQQEDTYFTYERDGFFEQTNVQNAQQNVNIYPKTTKKKQKTQNIEPINHSINHAENSIQDIDLENEMALLKDFEGTEVQKAFLYSEIFKNAKN